MNWSTLFFSPPVFTKSIQLDKLFPLCPSNAIIFSAHGYYRLDRKTKVTISNISNENFSHNLVTMKSWHYVLIFKIIIIVIYKRERI